jgi:hypothetical protein
MPSQSMILGHSPWPKKVVAFGRHVSASGFEPPTFGIAEEK